jgi:branched-chain amino acid transport system substrate-binding protein
MPNDSVQAAALVTAMRDRGCKRIASVTDREPYGKGVGTLMRQTAARLGLNVVSTTRISRRTRSFRAIRRAKPDCVAYTGITANGAVRMFRAAPHKAQLFASDGVAESGFTRRLPASAARRMTITVSTLAPDAYPGAPIIGNDDPYINAT